MRIKVLLVLVLFGAVFASLTVGTLSNYTAVSCFGIDIKPDSDKIRKQSQMRQEYPYPESMKTEEGPGEGNAPSLQPNQPIKQATDIEGEQPGETGSDTTTQRSSQEVPE